MARTRYLGRRLDTVEVNGTFYSLQKPDIFRSWYDQTPDDFLFAIKGSRYITHNKKLAKAETGCEAGGGDAEGHAPHDALRLAERIVMDPGPA